MTGVSGRIKRQRVDLWLIKNMANSDKFTEGSIRASLKQGIIGRELIFYEKTTSTNEKAIEIAHNTQPGTEIEGTVIVADAQEQGRGRFGREWISPPGVNLYFTVLLQPKLSPKEASMITLMSAVAVVSAIRECTGLNASIKWPNDILVGGRKVGGILTDMKADMDRVAFVAVGIGVNVNMLLGTLPDTLKSFITSLKEEKGETINRVKLLVLIFDKLEYWYAALQAGNKKALIREWLLLNSTIGNMVSVKTEGDIISGMAEGISEDGELIIKLPSEDTKKVYAGEVTIL